MSNSLRTSDIERIKKIIDSNQTINYVLSLGLLDAFKRALKFSLARHNLTNDFKIDQKE